jgi:sodium transport system permease protein
MKLVNVKLIFSREVRDQLRDRRTLFMIAVLPILLYPLLGMSVVQMAQFRREQPARILVIGAEQLAGLPPLVEKTQFAAGLFSDAERAALLTVEQFQPQKDTADDGLRMQANQAVQKGRCDAALLFPRDFSKRVAARAAGDDVPQPEIIFTTATDRSQIAQARLAEVLRRWNEQIVERRLEKSGLPPSAARPFDVRSADVAVGAGYRGAAAWSKILPVLLLIWALTGAFYPAIDLCAGEKERGTLETLLCSPAERSEIVVGKLLTIMLFSMVTSALNLASIGLSGWMLLSKVGLGAPPALAGVWLSLALLPVSALFSALSLALAAFARSTKEGQYYLMPLLLITMPLAILPAAPGVELTLGNSLIPVTGIVLLLRNMIEGNWMVALRFAAPVIAITLACCLLAIRWAVEQFNSETVLFRESERLEMGAWVRHLVRDRLPLPTAGEALLCGAVILVVRFFISFSIPMPDTPRAFAVNVLVTQLAVVVFPALAMTLLLTRSPRQTLLLRWPRWGTLAAAGGLALVLHPAVMHLRSVISQLYPVSTETVRAMEKLMGHIPTFSELLILMAVIPAVCEELAFRGFILSGLRRLGHPARAIVYSALLFGLTHSILQQQMVAVLLGLVLGLIAVRTESILPGIVFHVVHNSVGLAASKLPEWVARWPQLETLCHVSEGQISYDWRLTLPATLAAVLLFAWFWRMRPPIAENAERKRVRTVFGES